MTREPASQVAMPDAACFVASSRLRPGLDGGYTVAAMQRAADLAAAGADVSILTFDPAPIDGVVDAFIELGLADSSTRYRNLFAELRARPSLVRESRLVPLEEDARNAHPRDQLVTDDTGAPLLRLPFVERVDWHRSTEPIEVLDPDGEPLGALPGFGALHRLWVDRVVAEVGGRPAVVVAESRSLGELLGPHPRDYALVHTVHNAHTEPPHEWDSPMDTLWAGWFEALPSFDAVLWPTAAQRADAVRRVGSDSPDPSRWFVVPHPARPVLPTDPGVREPGLAVMTVGLRPQKRVEDAIRAWAEVARRVPGARLEIFGEGPERERLERLVEDLALGDAVSLRGHVPSAASELARASVVLLTSRFEGQSLAVLEALSAGVPVVSYDVPYGPGEMLRDSGGGVLVRGGDVEDLASAVVGVLGDAVAARRLGAAGRAWAESHGVPASMASTAVAIHAALEHFRS